MPGMIEWDVYINTGKRIIILLRCSINFKSNVIEYINIIKTNNNNGLIVLNNEYNNINILNNIIIKMLDKLIPQLYKDQ